MDNYAIYAVASAVVMTISTITPAIAQGVLWPELGQPWWGFEVGLEEKKKHGNRYKSS